MKKRNGSLVPSDRARLLAQEMERVFERVREKADEYCLSRGSIWGYEIDDWLLAERALVSKPGVEIRRNGAVITLDMELPPGSTCEVKTHATEEQILITSLPAADGRQIFRLVTLPDPIDPATLCSHIAESHLRIVVNMRGQFAL